MSGQFNDTINNPYDVNQQDFTPETLPHDEVLRLAISQYLMKVRVCLPATIITVKGNQKADVQPTLQTRYIDNTVVNLPPIQNVIVQMPVGKNFSIKYPIAVGDTGLLVFSDRSLDIWKSGTGGIVDPQDSRTHDYSDAIFIPGVVPFANQTTDSSKDLVLTAGDSQINLSPGGGFKIQNTSSGQELLKILSSLMQTLSTASTVAGGPFTPDVVQALNQDLTNLKTLME